MNRVSSIRAKSHNKIIGKNAAITWKNRVLEKISICLKKIPWTLQEKEIIPFEQKKPDGHSVTPSKTVTNKPSEEGKDVIDTYFQYDNSEAKRSFMAGGTVRFRYYQLTVDRTGLPNWKERDFDCVNALVGLKKAESFAKLDESWKDIGAKARRVRFLIQN